MPHPAPQPTPAQLRAAIVAYAPKLLGIHEVPAHSNRGPAQVDGIGVDRIESVTHSEGEPWCVATVQYIWVRVLRTTWADDTAGAYYLAEYAAQHGCVISSPVPGCGVVYHIGEGHAGTIVSVNRLLRTFKAVEGNEQDAVSLVARSPRQIRCTFFLRPELRDLKPA